MIYDKASVICTTNILLEMTFSRTVNSKSV
jgi:hypothetical protein